MPAPRTPRHTLSGSPIRLSRPALCFFTLALFLSACSHALGQPPQQAKGLQLGKVEVNGLERYTQEQVLKESGLQLGQAIDIPEVDEAANRLMASGFFKKLSYRYRSTGKLVTVTFVVEEAKEMARVVFDNFVWFSEPELTEAIRREVPAFDGTTPEAGDTPEKIKNALQALLKERKIQGQVEYLLEADPAGKNSTFLFNIKGVKIPICALSFPGAKDVKESDLLKASLPLMEQDFSRGDVRTFSRVRLIPIYSERGHLRASFLEPVVKPHTAADCNNGVSVTLQVDEGSIYTWEKAEWSGNTVLTAPELSAALGMKPDERANTLKIDKGRNQVLNAYGRKGYVEAKMRVEPELDDANRRVTYHYTMTEGPLYRMGALELKGLSEELTEKFKDYWKLSTGEVFDTSYADVFLKKAMGEIAASGHRLPSVDVQQKPDPVRRAVDVVITFK